MPNAIIRALASSTCGGRDQPSVGPHSKEARPGHSAGGMRGDGRRTRRSFPVVRCGRRVRPSDSVDMTVNEVVAARRTRCWVASGGEGAGDTPTTNVNMSQSSTRLLPTSDGISRRSRRSRIGSSLRWRTCRRRWRKEKSKGVSAFVKIRPHTHSGRNPLTLGQESRVCSAGQGKDEHG